MPYLTDPVADRPVGTGKVFSDGRVAARREAGVLVAPANTDIPSYVVSFNVAPVAAMDVLAIPGAGTSVTRLRRIVLVNPGNATAAIVVDLQLGIANLAGSGGSTPSANAIDYTGYATRSSGVTGGPDGTTYPTRTGDTTQAGNFIVLYSPLATVSVPAAAGGFAPLTIYDARDPRFKPITITGAGRFIVLRIPAVGAGATGFRGYAEFTVDDA